MRLSARLVDKEGKTLRFVKMSDAKAMIADGLALAVNVRNLTEGVRLSPLAKEKMRGQELALFEAGILKRKAYVIGGLSRTEHQPRVRFK